MKKICPTCKKEFQKPYSESKKAWKSRHIYCSLPCYNITKKGRASLLKGIPTGRTPWNKGKKLGKSPKNTRTIIDCIQCGKPFEIKAYRIGQAKYCSRKCHYEDNEGLSSENYIERRRFQRQIQKQVFERDNYTCQLCNQKGGDLQVDHIQSWAEYVEQRFNMENCRTICAKCHYKITFGKPMPPTVKAWGHNLLKGGLNL